MSISDSIGIKNIVINNNEKYSRAYIMGKLKFKPHERICYSDFKKGVNNLVATNNFDSFIYDFIPNGDGYDFIAEVTESTNKTFLKFGIHYDELYKSAALINLTQKQLLFGNDVLVLDFILGDNLRYDFEYYIDKGYYWSIGLKSRYNTFSENVSTSVFIPEDEVVISGINMAEIAYNDFTNQLFLQTLFSKDFALTLGAQHKRLKITSETFLEELNGDNDVKVFEKSDYLSLFGRLAFDSYSNKFFPTKGFAFDGEFQWYLSSSDYLNDFTQFSIAKASMGYAFRVTDRFSVVLESEGGFKIGSNPNNSLNFVLGGYGRNLINNFSSFYGYNYISVIGDSFVKGLITLDLEFADRHHFNFAANYANIQNDIFDNGKWFTSPDYSGYALGYGMETFLGPIEAKFTWSPELEKTYWFFNVGFWF